MDVLKLLKSVAPTIATLFGSPAAGVAASAVLEAIAPEEKHKTGKAAVDAAMRAVEQQASPELLAKLREIDAKLQRDLQNAGIRLEELAVEDTKDARARDVALRDGSAERIAWAVFFVWVISNTAVFYMIMSQPELSSVAVSLVSRVLGTLDAAVGAAVHFFLGSSRGSRMKDMLKHAAAK